MQEVQANVASAKAIAADPSHSLIWQEFSAENASLVLLM